jgi:predicted RNase H-like nuclease (RuvC/YqgF family)
MSLKTCKTFEIDTDIESQLEYFRYENYKLQIENKNLQDEVCRKSKGKKGQIDRNELVKSINKSLEPSLTSENKKLTKMVHDYEQKISEMSKMLQECDEKLQEYENDFKNIKVALEIVDERVEEVVEPKEVCLDFVLVNPASKAGGDKYVSAKDKNFTLYVPQKYSRLNGKACSHISVKLSQGDDLTETKNLKSLYKVKYVG